MLWKLPRLRHLLACERFEWNFPTLQFSLHNVLVEYRPPTGYPCNFTDINVLVMLGDGLGAFDFAAEFIRVADQHRIGRIDVPDRTLTDRNKTYLLHLFLSNVMIATPGDYEFHLFVRAIREPDGRPIHGSVPHAYDPELIRMEPAR